MRLVTQWLPVLFLLAGAGAHAADVIIKDHAASLSGLYSETSDGALNVSWAGGSALVRDVVGGMGENTRMLIRFNGRAALYYEAVASGYPYKAYFTLGHSDAGVIVDCIYASIRDGFTGALIAKAVCGVNKPLDAHYTDLLPAFSEQWQQQIKPAAYQAFAKDPGKPLQSIEGQIQGIEIARVYSSMDQLTGAWPETRVSIGPRRRSFGNDLAYIVHDAAAPMTPVAIEVATADSGEPFQRFDHEALQALLNSSAVASGNGSISRHVRKGVEHQAKGQEELR